MEVLNNVNIGVADYFFEKFVCRLEDKVLRYIISKNIFMYEKLNSILYNLTRSKQIGVRIGNLRSVINKVQNCEKIHANLIKIR